MLKILYKFNNGEHKGRVFLDYLQIFLMTYPYIEYIRSAPFLGPFTAILFPQPLISKIKYRPDKNIYE